VDAIEFARRKKAPKPLVPNLRLLNPGVDFTLFCNEPNDWLAASVAERVLYALHLLCNAWRYWKKRLPEEKFLAVERDAVLENTFATLVRVCGKLPSDINNAGAYIFTAIKNETLKEIERQQPPAYWIEEISQTDLGFTSKEIPHITKRFTVREIHDLLDSCCKNEFERDILYARCIRVFRGWVAAEYVTEIASQLGTSPQQVKAVLEEIQTRFIDETNAIKRHQHKKLIKRIPLSRISPDPTYSCESIVV